MSESQTPRCEHCGSDRIINRPPGCPYCGAPNCCTVCCNTSRLESELTATRARLAELEGFTTWLFDSAEMLYWPGNHEYPVENKPLAKKNARMAMEMYFAKKFPAYKEGKK